MLIQLCPVLLQWNVWLTTKVKYIVLTKRQELQNGIL